MKSFLILAVVCLTATAFHRPEHDRVQQTIAECQKETGSTVNELENVRLGKINPGTGKQVLCVHRKLGFMDENGDILATPYKQHVEVITFDKGRQQEFQACSKPEGENAEAKAVNFDKCFQSVLQRMGRD
uniref:Uncharacterized protein LOC114337228 n=1 Tax=Diabrotica virgifera virgifera TaxID=50390 RepID=A0A6P7GEQ1_DIAVI